MKKFFFAGILSCFLLMLPYSLSAEDDFGFGFSDEEEASSGGTFALSGAAGGPVQIGGKVKTELLMYGEDLSDGENLKKVQMGELFTGSLNFSVSGSNADGIIKLNLKPNFDKPAESLEFDEAYVRAWFGNFSFEGGLRKLTWGKADSLGPLDVVNPLDYSDLSRMTSINDIKIARPMLHVSYNLGNFSKIEAVWIPWFEGQRFSQSGRWAPAMLSRLPGEIVEGIRSIDPAIAAQMESGSLGGDAFTSTLNNTIDSLSNDLKTLEYTQGGLRFTTTLGSNDLGLQYYSGFIQQPSITMKTAKQARNAKSNLDAETEAAKSSAAAAQEAQAKAEAAADAGDTAAAAEYAAAAGGYVKEAQSHAAAAAAWGEDLKNAASAFALGPDIRYNRYHQIGADYARVIAGFNLRAELAANITSDSAGDDGAVYNPALLWSLGFDRDLFWGINGNFQCNENIRLMNDKIDSNRAIDTEAGTDMTQTRFTFVLSKKLFREEFELKNTVIWGVEDMDCYIIPAVVWTKGDVEVELSGGIFGGDESGELGQYRHNNFVKLGLAYSF
ncbi:MAG: hypothetical protein LBR96_00765 [Treponema sp.]|jgi:hypothetical protein|nr:hypothetical protein [Treponema sp.]